MQLRQRHSFTLTKSVSFGFFFFLKFKYWHLLVNLWNYTICTVSPKAHFKSSLRFYVLPSLSRGTFVIVVARLRQFTCKSHSFQLEFVMKVRGGGFINAFDSPPLHLLSTSKRVTRSGPARCRLEKLRAVLESSQSISSSKTSSISSHNSAILPQCVLVGEPSQGRVWQRKG